MFYPMYLGSPYRLSSDTVQSQRPVVFLFMNLQKDAWKKIEDKGGYLLIDHIVEAFFWPARHG